MTNYSDSHAGADLGASTEPAALGLRQIAKVCSNSGCPTIYQSDHGTVVVQGYAVSAHRAGVDLPDGELLVEIPLDLLREAVNSVN